MRYTHLKFKCSAHLGGGELQFSLPWAEGITEEDFELIKDSLECFIPPVLTTEEQELKKQQENKDWQEKQVRWEQQRYDKAEKIPLEKVSYTINCYYSKYYPYNDGYIEFIDDLIEWLEGLEKAGSDNFPTYIWGCKEIYPNLKDAEEIATAIYGGLFEGAEHRVSKASIRKLQLALDEFYEENQAIVGYTPDYSKAILLPHKVSLVNTSGKLALSD